MIVPIWMWVVSLLALVGVSATIATTSIQNKRANTIKPNHVVNETVNNNASIPASAALSSGAAKVPSRTIPKTTPPPGGVSQQIVPREVDYNGTITPYGQGPSDHGNN